MTDEHDKPASSPKMPRKTDKKPNNMLRNMTQLALPLGLVAASIVIVFSLDTILK